jgi:hypothetical protein
MHVEALLLQDQEHTELKGKLPAFPAAAPSLTVWLLPCRFEWTLKC